MELPLNMFVDPENLNKSSEDYIHPGKSSQNIIFRTILICYSFRFIRGSKLQQTTFRKRHQTEEQVEKMV